MPLAIKNRASAGGNYVNINFDQHLLEILNVHAQSVDVQIVQAFQGKWY